MKRISGFYQINEDQEMADRPNSADQLQENGKITFRLFKITLKIFSQGYNAFCDVQTCFIPSYGIKNMFGSCQQKFRRYFCLLYVLQKSFLAILMQFWVFVFGGYFFPRSWSFFSLFQYIFCSCITGLNAVTEGGVCSLSLLSVAQRTEVGSRELQNMLYIWVILLSKKYTSSL